MSLHQESRARARTALKALVLAVTHGLLAAGSLFLGLRVGEELAPRSPVIPIPVFTWRDAQWRVAQVSGDTFHLDEGGDGSERMRFRFAGYKVARQDALEALERNHWRDGWLIVARIVDEDPDRTLVAVGDAFPGFAPLSRMLENAGILTREPEAEAPNNVQDLVPADP